jgi:hypothetical protein
MVANTVVKWQWVDDSTARDVDDVDERLDIRVDNVVVEAAPFENSRRVAKDVRRQVQLYIERIECE